MTDWCDNQLRVTGDRDALEALMQAVADPGRKIPFSFERAFPTPPEFADVAAYLASDEAKAIFARLDELSGDEQAAYIANNPITYLAERVSDGSRLWREQNWGTGFESNGARFKVAPGRVTFHFASTWTEPDRLVAFLAQGHPTLEFEHLYAAYYADCAGHAVYRAGRRSELEEARDDADGCAQLLARLDWPAAAGAFREIADSQIDDDPEAAESNADQPHLRLVAVNGELLDNAHNGAEAIARASLAEFERLMLEWLQIGQPAVTASEARRMAAMFDGLSTRDLGDAIELLHRTWHGVARAIIRVESRLTDEQFDRLGEVTVRVRTALEQRLERRSRRRRRFKSGS